MDSVSMVADDEFAALSPTAEDSLIQSGNSVVTSEPERVLNPLWLALKSNVLTGGPNFKDWLRHLRLVLIMEDLEYVLEEKRPDTLTENAPDTIKKAYQKWVKDNNRVKGYMIASMSEDLQCLHEKIEDAGSILLHLKELYAWHDRIVRDKLRSKLFHYKMKEGSDIEAHCIKMCIWYDRLKALDSTMVSISLADLILHSLPNSFSRYVSQVYIIQSDFSFSKLKTMLMLLQAQLKADGNEPKRRKRKRHKTKAISKTRKGTIDKVGEKRIGKCLYCNAIGHWKRECPKFKPRSTSPQVQDPKSRKLVKR